MTEAASGTIDTEGFVSSTLSESWTVFTQNAVLVILGSLVMTIVGVLSLGICIGPLTVGFIDVIRKRRRGEAATISDIFGGFSQFGSSLGAIVLLALGTMIGLLLLIVPGIVFVFLAVFTLQELAYRRAGAIDAIKGSIGLVKAHVGPVVILMLVVFAISLVSGFIPFAGLVVSPFVTVMMVVGYEKLSGQIPGVG